MPLGLGISRPHLSLGLGSLYTPADGYLSLTASYRKQVQHIELNRYLLRHILPLAFSYHSMIPPSTQRNHEVVRKCPLSLPPPYAR